jgi:DNA-binding transcriptional LysR family regulator
MKVSLDLSDLPVDPIAAGYDIAIRVDEPRDTAQSSLISRKIILSSVRVICAAPDYLHRRGVPEVFEDLARHDCISYSYLEKPTEWHLIGPEGERVIKVSGPLITGHGQILRTAALSGLGITYAPRVFVNDALNTGNLLMVLPQYSVPEVNIYSIFPATRRASAKVRAFNEFMEQFFAKVASA